MAATNNSAKRCRICVKGIDKNIGQVFLKDNGKTTDQGELYEKCLNIQVFVEFNRLIVA